MLIFLTMVITGVLIGFTGAGGAGTIIAILTSLFGVPVHLALGTSLFSMIFTSLSGTISHFKENNVMLKIGSFTGLFGALGAFIGAHLASNIDENILKILTATMMFFSSILLWLKLFTNNRIWSTIHSKTKKTFLNFIFKVLLIGLITGSLSGLLGIGAAPFIQIGILSCFGLTARQAAGTTMLIIIPIAFVGGVGYYTLGNLNFILFLKVVTGTMIGSFIGAKFTAYANELFLKAAMITIPIIAGFLLIFGN